MRKIHQPRYSNYEIFYSGQMGTTSGRIVTRKRFKTEKERYEQGLKDFAREVKSYPITKGKSRRGIFNNVEIRQEKWVVQWERIKIGDTPVSSLANTASQKNIIKQIHPKNKFRNKGEWNKILCEIVEEYNSRHTYNYLTQYLKDERQGGLFRDYFEGRTNARLYKELNGKYLLFIKKGKKLKIVC